MTRQKPDDIVPLTLHSLYVTLHSLSVTLLSFSVGKVCSLKGLFTTQEKLKEKVYMIYLHWLQGAV